MQGASVLEMPIDVAEPVDGVHLHTAPSVEVSQYRLRARGDAPVRMT
jgi:hypothetical protein